MMQVDEKTIDVLLRFYVNLDLEDNKGFKPLELALFNKWTLGCHMFIQAGARLSQSQFTIHFLGIIAGLEDVDFRAQPWPRQPFLPREILSLLLEMGADINHKERLMHCSPLNYAVYKGYTELVDFLIGRGARLDTLGPSGLLQYSSFSHRLKSRTLISACVLPSLCCALGLILRRISKI